VIQLHCGNSLDVLATLGDDSVDSIVTDPPYGFGNGKRAGFMGKQWDYDVPSVDIWVECLRVLKPGGHLLAFAGTRTQHRMCVNIEDAGFEIRDMIAWVYGSGFPKSMNVSKAIDKRGGNVGLTAEIGLAIKQARLKRGLSAAACDQLFCGGTTNWSWFEGRPKGQRAPTPETFDSIAKAWPELEPLKAAVAEAEREVVGQQEMRDTSEVRIAVTANADDYDASARRVVDITTAHTPEAQQWEGWGTALKPALEPITVARKPFKGTVAANVLEHGTGALNIDGCRVGDSTGRWPSNLIHDGSEEVVGLFPQTTSGARKAGTYGVAAGQGRYGEFGVGEMPEIESSKGSAARFFYCAKANKKDREDGNTHPTVKPTALMAYLVRLITPPGGVVLDPFMGSGSTGKAAVREGFDFIGIEREEEYVAIASKRLQVIQRSILASRSADQKG